MRKLWPFGLLALAVAVGVAMAPYVWWVLGAAVAATVVWLGLAVLWIGWQGVKGFAARCWQWFLDQGVESPPL